MKRTGQIDHSTKDKNGEKPAGRLDLWLWHARFFRRREDAMEFVEAGKVRLERHEQVRRVTKAATFISPGDILVFSTGGRTHRVRVLSHAERRSDAAQASTLYSFELPSGASACETSSRPDHRGG